MSLQPRLPQPEWTWRAASGEMDNLTWVDASLELHRHLYRYVEDQGELRFQAIPYPVFSPPLMAESALEAQRAGRATLQEALILLFARPEWLIATRSRMWTSSTPLPTLLARLAEVYGVAPELHRGEADVLLRLSALLPSWHARRGSLPAARQVLDAAEVPALAAGSGPQGQSADGSSLSQEILCCHSLEWWEARALPGASPALRVQQGMVLFQGSQPGWVLRREDVLVPHRPEPARPEGLSRLLPPWAVLRPTLSTEAQP